MKNMSYFYLKPNEVFGQLNTILKGGIHFLI